MSVDFRVGLVAKTFRKQNVFTEANLDYNILKNILILYNYLFYSSLEKSPFTPNQFLVVWMYTFMMKIGCSLFDKTSW